MFNRLSRLTLITCKYSISGIDSLKKTNVWAVMGEYLQRSKITNELIDNDNPPDIHSEFSSLDREAADKSSSELLDWQIL